jgi:acylphosphatase
MNTVERAKIYFAGRVQGVGFRYSCRQVAKGFSLTGMVKNLDDGRVELVVEGEREEIEEFLKEIQESHLKSFIRQQIIEWSQAQNDLTGFNIIH